MNIRKGRHPYAKAVPRAGSSRASRSPVLHLALTHRPLHPAPCGSPCSFCSPDYSLAPASYLLPPAEIHCYIFSGKKNGKSLRE